MGDGEHKQCKAQPFHGGPVHNDGPPDMPVPSGAGEDAEQGD